jgi:hypothetical protein
MWVDGPGRAAADVDPRVRAAVAEMLRLKTATWQFGHRKMRGLLPSSRGTPGLTLAVEAMATVCDERIGREPVTNRSAGATTLTSDVHDSSPTNRPSTRQPSSRLSASSASELAATSVSTSLGDEIRLNSAPRSCTSM